MLNGIPPGGYCFPHSNFLSAITPAVLRHDECYAQSPDLVDLVKYRAEIIAKRCALPLACAGLASFWLCDSCPLEVAVLAFFFLFGPALILRALPLMFLPSPARTHTWRPSLIGGARGRGRGSQSRGNTASSRGRGFYVPEPQPVECHTALGGDADALLRWFKLHAGKLFHYPSFVQQGKADAAKGVYYLQFREERERSRFLEEFGSFEEHWLSAPVLYPELMESVATSGGTGARKRSPSKGGTKTRPGSPKRHKGTAPAVMGMVLF